MKLRKAMCPNDFPVSKVDLLSPRKNRTILVLFFSLNFMLCVVLLPKIQPLLKPENRGAAMPSFRKKLLRFMLGRRGHFSTTFSGFIPGVLDAAFASSSVRRSSTTEVPTGARRPGVFHNPYGRSYAASSHVFGS